MSGMTVPKSALRGSVFLVGCYTAALCWAGAAWILVAIPALTFSAGWILMPPAALTLVLWAVRFQGRERPPRREPRHVHARRRHVAGAVVESAPPGPRSMLSRFLLVLSAYTAALTWALIFLLAGNDAWALQPTFLVVPLLATLLAIFAWAYRGSPQT